MIQETTDSADVTTVRFFNLSMGTEYRIRVAGINSQGLGAFTPYQTIETSVDGEFNSYPPLVPEAPRLKFHTSLYGYG